ncbi:putative mechanosensitive ion channel MscS [Helianthus annuus]|nr:putative mechanosensitive ion channel MscS [Helianthus annuus]
MSPHVEQLLDTHLYLRDVIVPVGGTIVGTFAAWAVLPRIFRRFHKYSTEGPGTFLPAGSLWSAVPYEKSFWGALEVPVRYLITFMAFSQMLACGVAVQSILTVGGIGGVASAFAARDILGNVLSGLSVQLSQPFAIGDTIKVCNQYFMFLIRYYFEAFDLMFIVSSKTSPSFYLAQQLFFFTSFYEFLFFTRSFSILLPLSMPSNLILKSSFTCIVI